MNACNQLFFSGRNVEVFQCTQLSLHVCLGTVQLPFHLKLIYVNCLVSQVLSSKALWLRLVLLDLDQFLHNTTSLQIKQLFCQVYLYCVSEKADFQKELLDISYIDSGPIWLHMFVQYWRQAKITQNQEEHVVIKVLLWELIPIRNMNWHDCFSVAWKDKILID